MIAVDDFSNTIGNYDNVHTWSHTTAGNNRILIVGLAALSDSGSPHNFEGVTYNNIVMSLLRRDTIFGIHVELWYQVAPTPGPHNIIATHDDSFDNAFVVAMGYSFNGVDQSSPFGNEATDDTVNDLLASLTTTTANEMIVDIAMKYSTADPLVANGGQTAHIITTGGAGFGIYAAMSSKLVPSPGVATTGYTYTDDQDGIISSVALKPAGNPVINNTFFSFF
jgi:hypothetical protein